MRKQITTTLKFSELNKMTFHEVIRMMGFSFKDFNGVAEHKIKEDCEKLPYTMEYKTTGAVFKKKDVQTKAFLITYLFIYKHKYGILCHDSWENLFTSILNDDLFKVEVYLINRDDSMIVNVDENAFVEPLKGTELLLFYKDGSVNDAPKCLSLITGLDCETMYDFCGNKLNNLVNEVRIISDYLRQTNDWKFKEFCTKFNMNPPTYNEWHIPNYWDKPNYILASDYLYYLFFIKTVNNWDVSRETLKKYFEASIKSIRNHGVNPYNIEAKRYELLNYFNELVKVWDPQLSFCYEEHLFALKNRFKSEYVLNLTMTPSGIDTELYNLSAEPTEETTTANTPSPAVDYPSTKDEPSDFVSIANKQIELYKKKNRDYGNATDVLYKKHGFTYYQIMLEQKMQRIDSITNNKVHNFESLEDSLLDLSNYALLAVESLRKEKQGK